MGAKGSIVIRGARVNNLKNVNVEIPRGKLVVVTGLSGSGKSSLAFDTLFAEGQRRFAQSISSYARQFLGRMSKPDVDSIDGVPPAIAIEQKVNVKNPRSTVATTTEIYDSLRLLFARAGRTISPVSGREVKCNGVGDVMDFISAAPAATELYILADLRWNGRDDRVELLLSLVQQGYSRLWNDGSVLRIDDALRDIDNIPGEPMLLVDRLRLESGAVLEGDLRARLIASVDDAFARGDGRVSVVKDGVVESFSTRFELDGIEFVKPDEYLFSFNSPLGACPVCGGLGKVIGVSEDLVVPDKGLSIYDGAIAPWRGEKMGWFREHLIEVAEHYDIPVFTPYCELTAAQKDIIWNGRSVKDDDGSIVGINEFFEWVETQRYKIQYKYMLSRFSGRTVCNACHGSRLRPEALWVQLGGKNIHEILEMNVVEALDFFRDISLTDYERLVAGKALDEIISRLECIRDVGLGYLTLSRSCNTLSGGESQRVNLVTALGSSLVGSMYILDEPSVGLHSRDTEKLIAVLRRLRDLGNTVVVVEHDEEIIRAADMLIDMGPGAGSGGGEVVFKGSIPADVTPQAIEKSLTLQYICAGRQRYVRSKRPWTYSIRVQGAMEHNLKDITVDFPLGVLTVVSGVSGSGKSSLVGDILYPAMYRRLNDSGDLPGAFRGLAGNLDRISRVEYVDQNPIGKSSRSNAATYLKIYDDIRKLLADQQYAKINGFTPSFFSFNQDGGRCPECQGEGVVRIPMQFMADVTMVCEECGGKRFKSEVLEVRYRGRNVDDILSMSVDEAVDFFGQAPEAAAASIVRKLRTLQDVGLGYIRLGQSSSTLSGGESQRVKLAYFLAMSEESGLSSRQRILFIFDEPTTGLHFNDVEKLLRSFDMLLDKGHSLIVVEHNRDVINAADWLLELGPEAGDGGGQLVFAGTPEDLKRRGGTYTAQYL
ncbi:MAG: excinuclease ABC subunit UvrA [Bacteroidales bacterium]|nr:excinuclease ABC subunit UvrA [Bacteroidales bacterium]